MTDMPIDAPGANDPLETWEEFLRELESLPADRPLRAQLIRRAKRIIATVRRIGERDKHRPIFALIDPPGPFASVARWQRFLESMERAPPNLVSRDDLIREAKSTIAELAARGDPYSEGERRGDWLRCARQAADSCPERPSVGPPPERDPLSGLLRILERRRLH